MNTLIAEFIGRKVDAVHYSIKLPILIQPFVYAEELRFDVDWNWLMPVVRKCVEVALEDDELFLSDEYTSLLDTVPLAIMEDTYKVVVEFINKYNMECVNIITKTHKL